MSDLRVFFAGGITAYRALFAWVNPWVFVPMLVVYPIFQILFFAYLGRSAGVASDSFFLIGNTFVAAAITGLFGMGHSIGGERRSQTLSTLLASPSSRFVLFLGRALPTIANGFVVAVISFTAGALILRVHVNWTTVGALAVALVASCFACAGLGLCLGALGLRGRSVSVFADSIGAGLLIVSGANVPLSKLPDAVRTVASYVPLTHGMKAVRDVADGTPFADIGGLLGKEVAIGAVYLLVGLAMVRYFEYEGRRSGSLDRF